MFSIQRSSLVVSSWSHRLDESLIPPGSTVLDMGTGSGVGAIFAAQWAERVVAIDINPTAVRCARINCLLNDVHAVVSVVQGDLFAPVADQTFDVILFNPPYYRGTPNSALDMAFHADDVVERFIERFGQHLNPTGHALVLLSSVGDEAAFLALFRAHELEVAVIAERARPYETLTLYRLSGIHESRTIMETSE